jgi:hypothetical protein
MWHLDMPRAFHPIIRVEGSNVRCRVGCRLQNRALCINEMARSQLLQTFLYSVHNDPITIDSKPFSELLARIDR